MQKQLLVCFAACLFKAFTCTGPPCRQAAIALRNETLSSYTASLRTAALADMLVQRDDDWNKKLYGDDVQPEAVLEGLVCVCVWLVSPSLHPRADRCSSNSSCACPAVVHVTCASQKPADTHHMQVPRPPEVFPLFDTLQVYVCYLFDYGVHCAWCTGAGLESDSRCGNYAAEGY